MSRRGMALFAAMSLIWGIPYLLIKVAVDDVGPAVLVFLRLVIGALVLLPFALHRRALGPVLRRWPLVLAYGVVEVAAAWLLLADAELRVSSSLSGLAIAAVPLIGALLALATGGERLTRTRLVGTLLGLVGVTALLGLDLAHGADGRAVLELLGTAFCYALGPMIVARSLGDLPALGVNAVALAMAAVIYAPFAVPRLPGELPAGRVVAAIVVLGCVCTALAFLAFFALIAEIGAVRATVITYVNPAVAVVLGVTFLDERITVGTVVGFPLILLGSVLATRVRRAEPVPSPAGPVPS